MWLLKLAYFQASETVMQFSLGWFANPVLVDGRYPEVDIQRRQTHHRKK